MLATVGSHSANVSMSRIAVLKEYAQIYTARQLNDQ